MASSGFTPRPPLSSAVLSSDFEEFVNKARVTMMTSHHYKMFDLMNKLVDVTENLTVVERDLLFIAYERVIGDLLDSRHIVYSIIDDKSCSKKDKDTRINEIATEKLSKAHPMLLKLTVNFSTFYSEVYNSPESAVMLSKQAYDEALKELATWEEESKRQGMKDLAQYLVMKSKKQSTRKPLYFLKE